MKWIPDYHEDFLDSNKTNLPNHALCESMISLFLQKNEGKHIDILAGAGIHREKMLLCAKRYIKGSYDWTLQCKWQKLDSNYF